MTHKHILSSLLLAATILGIAGCQLFDDAPTGVGASAADSSALSNFIMGEPELDDWGAYYEEGDSFVRVDIPVAGALKVAYSTIGGWSGAIFLQTAAPVGLEIGLLTGDDGVTDAIDDVCVSYVEGGSFTSMPANVEDDVQGDWTEYLRVLDDGSTSHWWPAEAAFVFSGDETTACGVVNSDVQWEVIPGGAFEKVADADGDGVPDATDNCPAVANAAQTDTDSDGQGDACDNCPAVANAAQTDTDSDGQGDACDTDDDNDGVDDTTDNCPLVANAGQEDTDKNGVGDACENDADGDGWEDSLDNCPTMANPGQGDADSDGIGDACDTGDSDGDGIADASDNCPAVANPHQVDTDDDAACRFIDNTDGTVTDMDTGQMWERVANAVDETWNTATGATGHCQTSMLGGHTDWGLPTRAEFRNLIDTSQYKPALPSGHPFTVPSSGGYWSSDKYLENWGWFVFLNSGKWTTLSKNAVIHVWCVRD